MRSSDRSPTTALALTLVLTLAVALPSLLWPTDARAQAHPLELVSSERIVLLLNPMGAEHALDLAARQSLGEQGDLLFRGAHAQVGASTYVSPVYAMAGGYLELQPLSFLVLRAEVVGLGVWPIGMDGAGYYGVAGYDADVRAQSLEAAAGESASGWMATGTAQLQGMVPLGPVRLVLVDQLSVSRVEVGSAPYWVSMKHDLVLAREDLVLANAAFFGLEIDAAPDLVVRIGAYDDLRHVPASGYVGHQVGPLAMLEWTRPAPQIGSLALFVRGGGYTHHAIRAGEATILGGIELSYELGRIR